MAHPRSCSAPWISRHPRRTSSAMRWRAPEATSRRRQSRRPDAAARRRAAPRAGRGDDHRRGRPPGRVPTGARRARVVGHVHGVGAAGDDRCPGRSAARRDPQGGGGRAGQPRRARHAGPDRRRPPLLRIDDAARAARDGDADVVVPPAANTIVREDASGPALAIAHVIAALDFSDTTAATARGGRRPRGPRRRAADAGPRRAPGARLERWAALLEEHEASGSARAGQELALLAREVQARCRACGRPR